MTSSTLKIRTGFRRNENEPVLFLKTPGDYEWTPPALGKNKLLVMDTRTITATILDEPLSAEELDGKTQLVWFYHNGNYLEEPISKLYDGTVLDLIPEEWYEDIDAGNIKIIVHTAQESWGPIYKDKLNHMEATDVHWHLQTRATALGINPKGIVWITGDMHAEEYVSKQNCDVQVKSICQFLYSIANIVESEKLAPEEFYYEPESTDDIQNFAIMPNRWPKSHRSYMLARLWQKQHEVSQYGNYNAINGYYSEELEKHVPGINWSFPKRLHGHDICMSYCDLRYKADQFSEFDTKDLIQWEQLRNYSLDVFYHLPFTIDPVNFSENNCAGIDAMVSIKNEYNASAFALVTETWAEGGKMFISDALMMSILTCTPFIVVGNAGTLQFLHSKGFKTFGDFWDENYDNIEDDVERWEAIINVVMGVGKQRTGDWKQMRLDMQSIVKHNFENFFELADKEEQALYEYLHSL